MTLLERATACGLPTTALAGWASGDAERRLRAFFDLRDGWSRTHNVSGPRALADPWGTDLVDGVAAALISPIGQTLIDVGAGSGIPGLVVACLQPERPIVLVEPIAKRTAFLRSAASRLQLTAVRVERGRWPLSLPEIEAGGADVISRAVVDPATWPALAARGGAIVGGIIRMLAARRPPCSLQDFESVDGIDYRLGDAGERRVERWSRRGAG